MMMTRSMTTPPPPRWRRTLDQALRLARPGALAADGDHDIESLRSLCHSLIADLPQSHRHLLGVSLLHARSRDDIWHLRAQLFDAISMSFGEQIARDRISKLDTLLR